MLSKCTTTEKGDDIVAKHPFGKYNLYIEAKGETSSIERTSRYGKPFTDKQMLDHVAKAFYRAAKMLQQNDRDLPRRVGIALPDNNFHRKYVDAIEQSLNKLDIIVFWVSPNKQVTVNPKNAL